jgi:hypothetical protein
LQSASDNNISRYTSATFWGSVAAVNGAGWILLVMASSRLKWSIGRHEQNPENFRKLRSPYVTKHERGLTRKAVAKDPIAWLVGRQRGVRLAMWVAAGIGLFWLASAANLQDGGSAWLYFASGAYLAFGIIQAGLFAWVASRFLLDARRNGSLELLLTTPLGPKSIITGQWESMKRSLRVPILILLCPYALQINEAWSHLNSRVGGVEYTSMFQLAAYLLGVLELLVGMAAVFWAGFWYGLRAQSTMGAVIRTTVLAKGVPFVFSVGFSIIANAIAIDGISPNRFRAEAWFVPQFVSLLYALWLLRWSKRRLFAELQRGEPVRFNLKTKA